MDGRSRTKTVQAYKAARSRVPASSRATCKRWVTKIRVTDKEGAFELAHISRAQIEAFSQRSG